MTHFMTRPPHGTTAKAVCGTRVATMLTTGDVWTIRRAHVTCPTCLHGGDGTEVNGECITDHRGASYISLAEF